MLKSKLTSAFTFSPSSREPHRVCLLIVIAIYPHLLLVYPHLPLHIAPNVASPRAVACMLLARVTRRRHALLSCYALISCMN